MNLRNNGVRSPAFPLTATLTLALGIGLSTAVFTAANTLFLRPLPVTDQNEIVVLYSQLKDNDFNIPFGIAEAQNFARRSNALQSAAWFGYEGAQPTAVRDGAQTTRLKRALVSGNYFAVLGAQPILGRSFTPDDDQKGSAPAIVISYEAWQNRFGADPRILDRKITLFDSGLAYQIVGVMPQGLDYPRGTDFWAPIVPATAADRVPVREVNVIARLAPAAPITAARDELTTFLTRDDAPLDSHGQHAVVHTLPSLILGDVTTPMVALSAAASLLLLIACVNVANLLLVRGLTREREIAVRFALGAVRSRIVTQLLRESAILAAAGGVLGVAVAFGALKAFVAFAPPGVPRLAEMHLNWLALAGAAAISILSMLFFAVAPALATSRVALETALRSDARQSGSRATRRLGEALVVGQIALALLVLSAAGLIARSYIELQRVNLAFEPSHVLIGELALAGDATDNNDKQQAMLARIRTAVLAVPGVTAMSPVVANPFSLGWTARATKDGQSDKEAATNPLLNMDVVGSGYFDALGVRVTRGRAFTDADRAGTLPVVMLSESAAAGYWPGENPIGKILKLGTKITATVVGVVSDTRYRDLRSAWPSMYFPLLQSAFSFMPTTLAIRTTVPPATLVPALRRAIDESGAGVALASAAPFETFAEAPLAQPRLNALLLMVFAGAAVLLAAVGLFGVMATMVRQRRRELGIRMAVGASSGRVLRMVLSRGVLLGVLGAGGGVLASLYFNRFLVSMLYGVAPNDALTLAIVSLLLLVVAAVACIVPARASAKIEPIIVLRADG